MVSGQRKLMKKISAFLLLNEMSPSFIRCLTRISNRAHFVFCLTHGNEDIKSETICCLCLQKTSVHTTGCFLKILDTAALFNILRNAATIR